MNKEWRKEDVDVKRQRNKRRKDEEEKWRWSQKGWLKERWVEVSMDNITGNCGDGAWVYWELGWFERYLKLFVCFMLDKVL